MPASGHVCMRRNGVVIYDGHNKVVDSCYEVALRALLGLDAIQRVLFADLSGRQVVDSLRSLTSVVGTANVGVSGDQRPQIKRDSRGNRTIGTWIASFTADRDLAYDTLGLATSAGLLMAACSVPRVPLVKGESITVDWTVSLRGN